MEVPSFLWESAMKTEQPREAWNKGKLVGQKPPLRPKGVWAIPMYLQNARAVRDLATRLVSTSELHALPRGAFTRASSYICLP